jgi:hypothetical protein
MDREYLFAECYWNCLKYEEMQNMKQIMESVISKVHRCVLHTLKGGFLYFVNKFSTLLNLLWSHTTTKLKHRTLLVGYIQQRIKKFAVGADFNYLNAKLTIYKAHSLSVKML